MRITHIPMEGWLKCALAAAVLACPTAAQRQMMLLQGRVIDVTGGPIAGARVTSVRENSVDVQQAPTMPDGTFRQSLPLGRYTIRIAREGFVEEVRKVEVGTRNEMLVDIVLQVAPVRESVTVREQARYVSETIGSATRTRTPLSDVPQSVTVVAKELIQDQLMASIGDVVRYVPGITAHQGENNRDQVIIRGNSSSADFFVNGVRDDVQYYRDLYNLERVEALKGPNAMIFGRGGAGGVINRVTKEAGFARLCELSLQGGSFGSKRVAFDLDEPLGGRTALRWNGMYEQGGSFREFVERERYGVSPTFTLLAGKRTKLVVGYEHFRDYRTADRGIPSFEGKPVDVPVSTFYGNSDESRVHAVVNVGSVSMENQLGRLNVRNRTQVGDYDRGYQNFVPGAVSADKSQVAMSAYNNATGRRNLFHQTDGTYTTFTGRIRHTLLVGGEAGRQLTNNFRNTGYFGNTATTLPAPFDNPVIRIPVVFRQSATDADNHLRTNLGAVYVQDQVEVTSRLQFIIGVRWDYFDLQFENHRNSERLRRIDRLISPRAGLVYKPAAAASLYGSYSVSYLPSAGDQFSSLTTVTQQVKPEKFNHYEAGVKWDLVRGLSVSAAAYRLDRTNTRSIDPNDPTRIVQTGSQRGNGFEVGLNGSIRRDWSVAGGYAWQDAFVSSATAAAPAGARVAQVPRHSFALWNYYRIRQRWGAGVGILNRSGMFAGIDNTVTLPGYVRADAALFYSITEKVRVQGNVENLLDRKYYLNADSNTNISPGSPRAVRVALIARF